MPFTEEEKKQRARDRAKAWRLVNREYERKQKLEYSKLNAEKAKARSRKWYADNRDRAKEKDRKYRAENKERIAAKKKLYSGLYNSSYYSKNIVKERRRSRDYANKNPEKVKKSRLKYLESHPEKVLLWRIRRRARKAQARYGVDPVKLEEIILQLKRIPSAPCYWCGKQTKPGPGRHLDHIKPISRGGKDHWLNLAISCAKCNCSKRARSPEEYAGQYEIDFCQ